MSPLYLPIALTIAANAGYHLLQKTIRPDVSPLASLCVTYSVALAASVLALLFWPGTEPVGAALRRAGPTSYLLGVAIVGLEVGFLLAYRAGWDLAVTAAYANVAVALVLLPVGLALFGERLDARRVGGLVLAIAGLWLLSPRAEATPAAAASAEQR